MRIEKVYFPRWTAWLFILIIIPILIVIEYELFFGSKPYPMMGALFGLIFIMIIAMIFVASHWRLPYIIIERQTKSKRGRVYD